MPAHHRAVESVGFHGLPSAKRPGQWCVVRQPGLSCCAPPAGAALAGWSTALSGLVYAGFWIAPKNVAVIGGSLVILLGIAVTGGYCLSLRNKARESGI